MIYAVEMASRGMIYLPSFIKISTDFVLRPQTY
jgi:hypothetical protein